MGDRKRSCSLRRCVPWWDKLDVVIRVWDMVIMTHQVGIEVY